MDHDSIANQNAVDSIKKLNKLLRAAKQAQKNGKQHALTAILDRSYELSEKMRDKKLDNLENRSNFNNQFYVRVIGELISEE